MSIVRYRQWPTQSDIRHLLAPLLDMPGDTAAAGTWLPAVDIREHDAQFVLHADLPGVDPDSIDIDVDDRTLTVRAERRPEEAQWLVRERPTGTFARQLTLGRGLATDRIEASYADGVLTLTIPVAEESKPRKIQVSASDRTAAIEQGSSSGEQQATGDAVWHLVNYESQATFKIFKVRYEAQADLRIFKVKYLEQIGRAHV